MWNLRNKQSRVRKMLATSAPAIERLENRSLLAGNVIASLNGTHLSVYGDAADNSVEISVENNMVQVRGLDNTTVNGGTAVFIAAANTDTIFGNTQVLLGNGNDSVVFARNVRFNGSVTVSGGAGNDSLSSTGATFLRSVTLHGGAGDDTISLQNSTTQSNLVVVGASGDDLLSLTGMTINGNMAVRMSAGDDGVSLNNVSGTGSISVNTGIGDDDVSIRNSTISGSTFIRTRRGSDVVTLEDNTFARSVAIITGHDNDAVDVRDTNTFNGRLMVNTGDSRRRPANESTFTFPLESGDAINIAAANVFNSSRYTARNESITIPTAISDRIDAATTGLTARATAADTAAGNLAMTLSATASSSNSTASTGGVVLTKDANVTVSGTTLPGATVTLDTNGDGTADQTVTAQPDGTYSAVITATRRDLYTTDSTTNDQLSGLQTIGVTSTLAGAGTSTTSVTIDYVTGTLVRFNGTTATGGTESYEVELFDTLAPKAVANFLAYVNSGRYTDTIVHRSVASPAVIQGGGFTLNDGLFGNVQTDAGINVNDEFAAARSNIAGTLALANAGATNNSTTSQWFINTSSNAASLDSQQFAVFGRVVGNGMTIVNSIRALTTANFVDESNASALTDVPVRSTVTEFGRALTGTVTTTANSSTVVGTGTRFLTELQGGGASAIRSRIQIGGQTFSVLSIQDDTNLTLASTPTTASTNVAAFTDINNDNQFIKFTTVERILI